MRIGPGQLLTAHKAEVLRILGTFGAFGVCPGPVTPGGTLAQLRDFGLAEVMAQPEGDRIGDVRTRINAAGTDVLAQLGML